MDFDQINMIYSLFKSKSSSIYSEISSNDKWLCLVDIDISNDTIRMWYCFGINRLAVQSPPISVFGATDYWYYGDKLGKCGNYAGTVTTSDAAYELEKMIRYNRAPLFQKTGFRIVPINVSYPNPIIAGQISPSPIDPINPNDNTPQDNQFDYLLAHGYYQWPNFHLCLSPQEMNFYYSGAWTLIYQQNTYYPSKQLIYTNIANAKTGLYPNIYNFAHGLETRYGNITYVALTNSLSL